VVYSPEVRHPVEVGADQEAHLVAWLSKRLGTPLKVPHLGDLGYSLVGGRLLPGERGPVAQFMYQDGKGQRLTLYVRVNPDDSGETAFRFAQEHGVGVFYWLDRKLGYALSGEVEKNELLRIATAVYRQLNP
jgi:anti-sigma factor RsiW